MRDQQRTIHLVGAGVAVAVGLGSAIAVLVFTSWSIGFVGVPIAGIIGWFLADALRPEGPRMAYATLMMAGGCTVLGALATSLIAFGDVPGALGMAVIGIVFYGIPAFLLLFIPAVAWATITANQLEQRLGPWVVMPSDTGIAIRTDVAIPRSGQGASVAGPTGPSR